MSSVEGCPVSLIRTRALVQTWRMSGRGPRALHSAAMRAEALDLLAAYIAGWLIVLIDMGRIGPARVMLALAFTFFVPGRAIVTNWPRAARWSAVGMPVVMSLAVTALAAMVALWAHFWHPLLLFQIEAWLSLAGLGVGIARRRLGLSDAYDDRQDPTQIQRSNDGMRNNTESGPPPAEPPGRRAGRRRQR